MTADIVTYPEMNEKIVELLRWNKENPAVLYAASRIEELEAEAARLLERAEAEVERIRSKPSTIEAHRILDEADWPQGHLTDRVKRLARALSDFREIADDPSRSGLFRSLEKTSAALRREHTEAEDLRGALRAALSPLEAAADALVPPGARVEKAAGLVDEAIVVIREEIE